MKQAILQLGIWLGIVLVVLGLAAARPIRQVQLTVVNKSEKPLGIRLDEINPEENRPALFYYLTVPQGNASHPAVKKFSIVRERYAMQIYYIETYDPVYGWSCTSPQTGRLEAGRNTRLVFLKCGLTPPNTGEAGVRKFGPVNRLRRR